MYTLAASTSVSIRDPLQGAHMRRRLIEHDLPLADLGRLVAREEHPPWPTSIRKECTT